MIWINREGIVDRRSFIKNVAIGGAALGLGSAVFKKPQMALASGQPEKEEGAGNTTKPEIIAACHCKKVVLKLINLNPRFTVCHCDTCQLLHNGPWYGVNCGNIKVIDGKEYVSAFTTEHGKTGKSGDLPRGWAAMHFCSNCGSRLYYNFNDKVLVNSANRYNVSAGLIHSTYGYDLMMENELFFDEKPAYYSFHETKKFSSGDMIKYYKM